MPFIPEKKPLTEIISKEMPSEIKISEDQSGEVNSEVKDGALVGLCDGLVPESGCLGRFDTVPGKLFVVGSNPPTGALPLCITNDWLEHYNVTVRSIGGYSFKYGAIFLNQLKGGKCFEGIINVYKIAEIPVPGCPCAVDYVLGFTTLNPICLDSNHLPEGFDQTPTLGKWVDACYCTTWEGCHEDYQEFKVILAHKAMSQNPKLPIIKTSPV
jgi:hypothetical protein